MKQAAAPTRASLHEAALAYLAKSAASADSVRKVLERRIGNWARRAARVGQDSEDVEATAARAKEEVPGILARLVEVGLVNDAQFAESRTKRMSASGRSRRAIAAHLRQKGVAEAVTVGADEELAAAITFARKRRLGPFARDENEDRRKALGTMARAGFDFSVCERVMRMDRDAAEELLHHRRAL